MIVNGESVDIGRRKRGVTVGDDANRGNTSLNAGVRLAIGATTSAGESVMDNEISE